MKLRSVRVLVLSFAFVSCACLSTVQAQETSIASTSETNRCVKWMKATVSSGMRSTLDPADFCSGITDGKVGGWYTVRKCGDAGEDVHTVPKYCTSSGQITHNEAWAAGFSSLLRDGRELLDGASDSGKDSQHAAAVFYSRTAVWMGDLRVPAGMYELRPSKSSDVWMLAVAKQGDSASETPHSLGSVLLKSVAPDSFDGKNQNLVISTKPLSERCPGPSPDTKVRELHFIYGSTDVFVCVRPDQALLNQQSKVVQNSSAMK